MAVSMTMPMWRSSGSERSSFATSQPFLPGIITSRVTISWHSPCPAANSPPWQRERTIPAHRNAGYRDLSCVQNQTVVTNAFKGEDLNHSQPIFAAHDVPVLYNFQEGDMKWVTYQPK